MGSRSKTKQSSVSNCNFQKLVKVKRNKIKLKLYLGKIKSNTKPAVQNKNEQNPIGKNAWVAK